MYAVFEKKSHSEKKNKSWIEMKPTSEIVGSHLNQNQIGL